MQFPHVNGHLNSSAGKRSEMRMPETGFGWKPPAPTTIHLPRVHHAHVGPISRSHEANWRDNCFWALTPKMNSQCFSYSVNYKLSIWHLLSSSERFFDAFKRVKTSSVFPVISKEMNGLYYFYTCILDCFPQHITQHIIHANVPHTTCVHPFTAQLVLNPCQMGSYCYYHLFGVTDDSNVKSYSDLPLYMYVTALHEQITRVTF